MVSQHAALLCGQAGQAFCQLDAVFLFFLTFDTMRLLPQVLISQRIGKGLAFAAGQRRIQALYRCDGVVKPALLPFHKIPLQIAMNKGVEGRAPAGIKLVQALYKSKAAVLEGILQLSLGHDGPADGGQNQGFKGHDEHLARHSAAFAFGAVFRAFLPVFIGCD